MRLTVLHNVQKAAEGNVVLARYTGVKQEETRKGAC
jgi:hypothetical protein